MSQQHQFTRDAFRCFTLNWWLCTVATVGVVGCGDAPIREQMVAWDGFQSEGWYAVDKSEWNDCATSITSLPVGDADGLAMSFDMQDAAHATYRNHDIPNRDWSEYRSLILDFENPTEQSVGLIAYLSNKKTGSRWHLSVKHEIPAGTTPNVRIDLIPKQDNDGPPKDWSEEAWQFKGLDRENIRRIALSVRGEKGLKGTITVSNPRFTKLAEP